MEIFRSNRPRTIQNQFDPTARRPAGGGEVFAAAERGSRSDRSRRSVAERAVVRPAGDDRASPKVRQPMIARVTYPWTDDAETIRAESAGKSIGAGWGDVPVYFSDRL